MKTQNQNNSISSQNESLISEVDEHLDKHKGKYGLVMAIMLWLCTPLIAMLVIFGFGYFTKANADKIRNNKRRRS
jgi:hypothetical protein